MAVSIRYAGGPFRGCLCNKMLPNILLGLCIGAPDFRKLPYNIGPKGPTTSIRRTWGFYIGNCSYGLGQVFIIKNTWTLWAVF